MNLEIGDMVYIHNPDALGYGQVGIIYDVWEGNIGRKGTLYSLYYLDSEAMEGIWPYSPNELELIEKYNAAAWGEE